MPFDPAQANPADCAPVIFPSDIWRCGFEATVVNGINSTPTALLDLLVTGPGQTVNQTGGNLLITTGTTVNSETIIRSKRTFRGAHLARWKAILSQRIANQSFIVELADLLGDGLAFTITNATTVVITIPNDPLTGLPRINATQVGQTFTLGNIRAANGTILTTAPPQDCVIASVSGNDVTVTVAGFPASGSGTLMAYGMNNYRATYDGATPTNMKWEPRRRGYQQTAAAFTMSTTASPGHVVESRTDCTNAALHDVGYTTTGSSVLTSRSIRLDNLPDDIVDMYIWIRVVNGTSIPSSTTTFTVGFVGVEMCGNGKVTVLQPQADAGVTTVAGTVTVVQTTGSSLNAQVTGAAAAGSTATGNPVLGGGVAKTAIATARSDGQIVTPLYDKIGRTIGAGEQVRDLTQMAPMVTLTGTTETTIVAATSFIFNDLRALILTNTSATGTRVDFRTVAAGTVVFSIFLPATTSLVVSLPVLAKQATVNTAWTAQLGTAVTDVRITPFSVQAN